LPVVALVVVVLPVIGVTSAGRKHGQQTSAPRVTEVRTVSFCVGPPHLAQVM
jgi:hypothetical protein